MIRMAIAAVAASGLLLGAAPAHAGGHVSLSVGVGLPVAGIGYGYAPGYATYGAPTYYGPPAPVYAPPPVVYAPAPYPVYGPGYRPAYGPGYYAPRVVYRPARPYYDGRWHGRGDWRR